MADQILDALGASAAAKVNIVIDASQLDLFLLCEARYNYRYNMNLSRPVYEKSTGLDRGSIVHDGQEVYWGLLQKQVKYSERVEAALMKMREVASNPDVSNSSPEELNFYLSVMEQNWEYWRFEDETLEVLAVEQPFMYQLYEDDVIRLFLSGKIDVLVNKPALAGSAEYLNLPIDHKTFDRDSPISRLSNQFMNYAAVCQSNFLLVNRIGFHKLDGKTPKPPEHKFKRVPLSYDPQLLQEWKDNVTMVLVDKLLPCLASGRWPMNFTSCLKFNRLCEYYEICESSGKEAKAFKIEGNYVKIAPWDVTKKLQSEQEGI